MEFGQIQNTDIRPSRIGLGTWAIGGWKWGGADDDAAVATIDRALDSGINLIDTAPAYGQGHSEEIVGRAIQGRRERVVVATKVGLEWDERGEPRRNASAPPLDHIEIAQVAILDSRQIFANRGSVCPACRLQFRRRDAEIIQPFQVRAVHLRFSLKGLVMP